MSPGHLLGRWLVDAAVGRGALTVDVEVVSILLVVRMVPETQNHTLVTFARLLVALRLVELTCAGQRF